MIIPRAPVVGGYQIFVITPEGVYGECMLCKKVHNHLLTAVNKCGKVHYVCEKCLSKNASWLRHKCQADSCPRGYAE